MPITIDEVTAEVVPAPPTGAPASPGAAAPAAPEAELRHQGDVLARLEQRAARLRAD